MRNTHTCQPSATKIQTVYQNSESFKNSKD